MAPPPREFLCRESRTAARLKIFPRVGFTHTASVIVSARHHRHPERLKILFARRAMHLRELLQLGTQGACSVLINPITS